VREKDMGSWTVLVLVVVVEIMLLLLLLMEGLKSYG
jgi:diacylglycerol kinase